MLDLLLTIAQFALPKLWIAFLFLLSVLLVIVGMYCRFWLKFNFNVSLRYGYFAITFNGINVLGLDINCVLGENVIIIASPFGY